MERLRLIETELSWAGLGNTHHSNARKIQLCANSPTKNSTLDQKTYKFNPQISLTSLPLPKSKVPASNSRLPELLLLLLPLCAGLILNLKFHKANTSFVPYAIHMHKTNSKPFGFIQF